MRNDPRRKCDRCKWKSYWTKNTDNRILCERCLAEVDRDFGFAERGQVIAMPPKGYKSPSRAVAANRIERRGNRGGRSNAKRHPLPFKFLRSIRTHANDKR